MGGDAANILAGLNAAAEVLATGSMNHPVAGCESAENKGCVLVVLRYLSRFVSVLEDTDTRVIQQHRVLVTIRCHWALSETGDHRNQKGRG
ncbi:hypothetical protein [Marinobacter sp. X15-166B]|uniref:hypothetical protein n=1 Tax=Marinobacter sp. X15-166B TaxID=1897620 RepID=UPI00085C433F|nr:hypothetical protein [Marinobacter sp. X15-166B]